MLGGLVAVAAVVVVALIMRAVRPSTPPGAASSSGSTPERWADDRQAAAADDPRDGDDDDGNDDDDPDDEGHIIAVTSDGAAFVPHRHAVRLVPPEEQGETWKVGAGIRSTNLRGEQALAMSWHSADFTGARVVRGEADEGPWRMEALGREGEYQAFVFETREGAEAAQRLFERLGVVRLGEDEDGQPMPPSPEQFAEARRMYLETEAALELPDDEDAR